MLFIVLNNDIQMLLKIPLSVVDRGILFWESDYFDRGQLSLFTAPLHAKKDA